ncbi:MAG TPA: nucleoside hydrolase [Stellaceae bacterium]|nr:nucleoside hydrolase [Stellaceae bacterium]
MIERRTIVIDTDPGQDDAVAILLALALPDRFDVRAITAVAGNVPVALTAANALRIVELAGRGDVPVYAGCAAPMILPLETAEYICGADGLDGSGLPPPIGRLAAGHAVEALIALLRAAATGGVTLCALGPLTNIALALRLAPDIADRIDHIVVMGGALGLGNITPAAEFNIYVDPHAAAVVLGAGVKVTLIGLHLTLRAVAEPAHLARLQALGSRTGRAVHGMLARPRAGGLGGDGHPMHDVCVVGYLAWPELFGGRECFVEVETASGSQRGRTTIDWNGRLRRPANCRVLDTIEAGPFFDRMIDALSVLP